MSFNKITILGNLGRDVELRYTPQGKQVATFSVATTEKRKGQNDVTTWFRCTAWERLAEIAASYLKKGSQVYIEGRLSSEEWADRDGNKRFRLDVRVNDLQLLGSREERVEDDHSTVGMPRESHVQAPIDDVPF